MKKPDNCLKEARGIRTQKEVAAELKKVDPRVDDKLLSNYERGICLPTKTQLIKLCRLYGTTPKVLYKRGVLSLANALKHDSNEQLNLVPDTYSFTVKLPNEFREKLTDEKLKECGYNSRADWIIKSAELLTKIKEPAPTDSIIGIEN